MKTAFIIIDVQNILVETGFETEKLLEKIAYLQDQARKPVSYTHLTLPTICSV